MNFVGNSKMESTTLLKIKLNLIVLSTKVKRHFTDWLRKNPCLQWHGQKMWSQLTQYKSDVIKQCKRQLVDVATKTFLFFKALWDFEGLSNPISALEAVHKKEKEFLLSNIHNYVIPHFYIIWKIQKNPPVRRPIFAGYKWIFTPASIFVGYFLKEFTLNLIQL